MMVSLHLLHFVGLLKMISNHPSTRDQRCNFYFSLLCFSVSIFRYVARRSFINVSVLSTVPEVAPSALVGSGGVTGNFCGKLRHYLRDSRSLRDIPQLKPTD